jgi:hypothetical protein
LLDGILFEVFFDPDGKLRNNPKVHCFNDIFSLQIYPQLASSFEFIAGCLHLLLPPLTLPFPSPNDAGRKTRLGADLNAFGSLLGP